MAKISLEEIIEVVDEAYNSEEHLVLRAFKGEQVGDKLAEFLAAELKDTYNPSVAEDSVNTAVHAIRMARNQLEDVALALLGIL